MNQVKLKHEQETKDLRDQGDLKKQIYKYTKYIITNIKDSEMS